MLFSSPKHLRSKRAYLDHSLGFGGWELHWSKGAALLYPGVVSVQQSSRIHSILKKILEALEISLCFAYRKVAHWFYPQTRRWMSWDGVFQDEWVEVLLSPSHLPFLPFLQLKFQPGGHTLTPAPVRTPCRLCTSLPRNWTMPASKLRGLSRQASFTGWWLCWCAPLSLDHDIAAVLGVPTCSTGWEFIQ